MKNGGQNKKAKASFGITRRGIALDKEKMKSHFFRVMFDSMLKDATVYIPTEFVKNNRSRLGSSVKLKVANGDTWEVELAADDDGLIWLVKGWEDFTKHHCVKQGDIVVFRLEQDSLFHVMVFEPTGSEKKYSSEHVNNHGRLLNVKVEEEIDVGKDTEKLKEVQTKKRGREEKRNAKLAAPLEIPNHPLETKMRGAPRPRRDDPSTSSTNPSFSITITEYSMKRGFTTLPTAFVHNHMRPESGPVKVSAEDGSGSWDLSYIFSGRTGRTRGRGHFGGGWPVFRRDNSLELGDVCRFELTSNGQMKVTVERH
ncbi:unnamed protein product [Linum trigynum]|uniref:TF-B3 domain-containing protein n=1 Tax=Linum trigynum TaxID=586398 RepID=A0AAV2E4K8_9ROSI